MNARFYIEIGGHPGDSSIKYGFRAPIEAYKDIQEELGVVHITDAISAKGVAFGINSPRAPKVRINYTFEQSRGAITRFCSPSKLGQLLIGSLNGKTILVSGKKVQITSVSAVR
jgi:hypothetical protein